MAASSSSSSSSAAGSRPAARFSPGVTGEFSPALKPGEVIFPWRQLGDLAEKPVIYPTSWPPLVEAAMKRRGDTPIRLYADGIFDLCHYGHFRALEQAKKSFPNVYLIVGCCSDKDTHLYKGQTVMTQEERYETMRHCKWIDEIVVDSPWVISEQFVKDHDIDFVCHDDLPYADTSGVSGCGDVYLPLKKIGKFHATQRTEGVSTSDLIVRIVKRYDDYVRRNLSRGYTGKDMGVPFIKEKQLQLEMELEKRATAARAQLQHWADAAEGVQYDFLQLFHRDGPIRTKIRSVQEQVMGTVSSLLPNVGQLRSPNAEDSGAAAAAAESAGKKRKRSADEDESFALGQDMLASGRPTVDSELASASAAAGPSSASPGKGKRRKSGSSGASVENGSA